MLQKARHIYEMRDPDGDEVNQIDVTITDCLYSLRRYEEAAQCAERCLQFALEFYYRISEERFGRAHLNLARCLQKLGELQRAISYLRQLCDMKDYHEDPIMVEVCEMMAETLMQQGEYEAAEQYFNRVMYIREQVERDEKGVLSTNLAIATCFKQRGEFLEAERILNECMVKGGILFG